MDLFCACLIYWALSGSARQLVSLDNDEDSASDSEEEDNLSS
jgi:hypothetical protein